MSRNTIWLGLAVTALVALTSVHGAKAAYLSLGTVNTSNAITTVTGSTAGPEFLAKNGNGSTATAFGLYGLLTAASPTVTSAAVRGHNSATNSFGYGMWGSQNGSGTGVYGYTPSGKGVWGNTSSGIGVRGSSSGGTGVFATSSSGIGVVGQHLGTSGTSPGVSASTNSTAVDADALVATVTSTSPGLNSEAVRGVNNGTGSNGIGVYGQQNGSGYGVYGYTPSGRGVAGFSNTFQGVYGHSDSNAGVKGLTDSTAGTAAGVLGGGTNARGVAGFSDSWQGVYGHSNSQAGVVGESGSFDGVYGQGHSNSAAGVSGHNDSGGYGVWGGATGGYGVYGSGLDGVYGSGAFGTGAYYGVYGTGETGVEGSGAYGVSGFGTTDAGYFEGKVNITGALTVGGGCTGCAGPSALQIDDPLDPAHKYLQHSTVVSPQMKDLYDGIAVTNARGFAPVTMPRWFQALNRTFRYQLTILGTRGWNARVVRPITNNRFTIQSDQPRVRVSWQVTGIRHDRYATAHPVHVVVPKAKKEQGKYLHPELYGKPKSQGIGYLKPSRLPKRPRLPKKPTFPKAIQKR